MNDAAVKAAARARRFDAELAEVLEAPSAMVAGERGEPRPVRSWIAAALVLLGVLVTAAVAWQQRADAVAAQEPVRIEPPELPGDIRTAQRAGDLADWPRDLRGAHLWLATQSVLTRDLGAIGPFTELRFLGVHGDVEWTPESMAALAGLQQLEMLTVPVGGAFATEHFRVLGKLPALRFLTLELQRDLSVADVDAIATLPALVSLTISEGGVGAAAMQRLANVAGLRQLVLDDLDRCPEDALCALRHVRQLRELHLKDMGRIPRPVFRKVTDANKVTAGLTPAVARALAGLPELRSVTLTTVDVTAAAIAALPPGLEHVGILASPHLGGDVFSALARFTHLRSVDLDTADRFSRWQDWGFVGEHEAAVRQSLEQAPPREPVWRAQAELLPKIPVRELGYTGAIPIDLREVIPKLPLVALSLRRTPMHELAIVRDLPGLRRVTLEECGVHVGDLQPLRDVPNLLRLSLRFVTRSDLDVAAVRELLPNVTVTTHGF